MSTNSQKEKRKTNTHLYEMLKVILRYENSMGLVSLISIQINQYLTIVSCHKQMKN